MKLWLYCVTVVLVMIIVAPSVSADIALPRPENTNSNKSSNRKRENLPASRMIIEAQKGAQEVTLQIPRSTLRQLRAELEDDATMTGSINSGDNGALRTIIAGLFLFLSLAAAGIWFARTRRSPASRAVATVLLALAATGAAATIALANAAPPQWARYLHAGTLPRAIKPNEALTGFVRVEVVDHGDNVRLIMPEATEEAR